MVLILGDLFCHVLCLYKEDDVSRLTRRDHKEIPIFGVDCYYSQSNERKQWSTPMVKLKEFLSPLTPDLILNL